MDIIKADKNSFEDVKKITHTTIMEIYPKYYPPGAVEFFLKHHSDESIVNDIEYGRIASFISVACRTLSSLSGRYGMVIDCDIICSI